MNNVGLQNSGIQSIRNFSPKKLYSIAALDQHDWDSLYEVIPELVSLEINLSCPNVANHPEITDEQVNKYLRKYKLIVFKLSPTAQAETELKRLVSLGATHFHLFNTLPTERGGESGKRLRDFGLRVIQKITIQYPNITIIAGGGIYSADDINLYRNVGAEYFSLASIFLNPVRARKLLTMI